MIESSTQMAWRRFARGLPASITSVEDAIGSGARTFTQWRTCLDTANHFARRVNSHVHRRAIGSSPENVAWSSLRLLAGGQSLTADDISRVLDVHVDVVRRALKSFRARGWVQANPTYTKFAPRVFSITPQGSSALTRLEEP